MGKPDIIFVGPRVAIFVDGCFWHGCPEHSTRPKTNANFWTEKIRKNQVRDLYVAKALAGEGWRVMRVWEHNVKLGLQSCADVIEAMVRG